MRAITILALSAMLVAPCGGFAQKPPTNPAFTANKLLAGCRAALTMGEGKGSGEPLNPVLSTEAGICMGVVSTVYTLGYFFDPKAETNLRFCIPKGSTVGQAMRIVVRELDQKPELLHLDLGTITAVILHNFWPCT
jgi:Rap1a immunity proteins